MNLLTSPVISTELEDGTTQLDLPGVLAATAAGQTRTFPRVRPHHAHAWHIFLVQIGVLATLNAGANDFPRDAGTWRDMLRDLAGGEAPWHLIPENPDQPAFLQPPQPKDAPPLKSSRTTPDDLDIIVTSREHSQKSGRITTDTPEDWIFALIALQTLSGMSGQHNKPIMRMQGARGARPFVSLTPDARQGLHIRRDLHAVLGLRLRHPPVRPRRAPALLWTLPWQGSPAEMLRTSDLDTLCVEVCRRVRLRHDTDGGFVALLGGSTAPRTQAALPNANGLGGDVQDPWSPIHRRNRTAFRPSDGKLSIRDAARLVFDNQTLWEPAPLQNIQPTDIDTDMTCVIRCMTFTASSVRFAERNISVPKRVRRLLVNRASRRDSGRIARDMYEDAEMVRTRALKPAVLTHLQDGARIIEKVCEHNDPDLRQALETYDSIVDRAFTHHLHSRIAEPDSTIDRDNWLDTLEDAANEALNVLRRRASANPGQDFTRRTARARLLAGIDGVADKQPEEA